MKPLLVLFLSLSLCATLTHAQAHTPRELTVAQARELVLAALNAQQRRLPKLGAESTDAPNSPSAFLYFTVVWEGTPNSSVVVGNYAVDPRTGDVFSATIECHEEKNKLLRKRQARARATLRLSATDYQRLKTKGPLCEPRFIMTPEGRIGAMTERISP